jgi:hypothetical protein
MVSDARATALIVTLAATLYACAGPAGTGSYAPRGAEPQQSRSRAENATTPTLYVANYDPSNVTEYPVDANGDVSPLRTIAGPLTKLIHPLGVAIDTAGNIYVSNAPYTKAPDPQFAIFAPGASGNANPVRQISARRHGNAVPFGIAVDRGGYLYEADTSSLALKVFSPGANGEVAPVRVVAGPRTGIHDPYSVTVDGAGNAYVPDGSDAILKFGPGQNGNVNPLAAIRGPHTQLNGPTNVALDASANIYVSGLTGTILVYPSGANGDVAPARIIALTPKPYYEAGLIVRGSELFVAQSDVGSKARTRSSTDSQSPSTDA